MDQLKKVILEDGIQQILIKPQYQITINNFSLLLLSFQDFLKFKLKGHNKIQLFNTFDVQKIAKISKHGNEDMDRGLVPPSCCLSNVEFLPPYSSPSSLCWQTEGCHGRGTQCFHWGHLRYKKEITMACG